MIVVCKVSATKSHRIAMRSKRALEAMHEIKCRQEQNRANKFADGTDCYKCAASPF